MMLDRDRHEPCTLCVVVPVFNEEAVIGDFHARLCATLDALPCASEILYVNDGSSDRTPELLRALCDATPRVRVIGLSRNFGKEIAMSAGLDHAEADAVVIIDADLQDPPELIPALMERWREGHDVVYARRERRQGDSGLKKASASAFYRVLNALSDFPIPRDTGDFRLMSRRAVKAVCQFRERHRFMKGLFAWIGYSQVSIGYEREPRGAGGSKFNYWTLWNFALEGITSFSVAPLKAATYLGMLIAFCSFLFAGWIVAKTLLWGDPVRGYPTIMTTILMLGGMNLMAIGLLGEYVGRIFNESKRRPLYFVNEQYGGNPPKRLPETPDSGQAGPSGSGQ
jgi:glycosyltransferase involved in cell wall biosynthesis